MNRTIAWNTNNAKIKLDLMAMNVLNSVIFKERNMLSNLMVIKGAYIVIISMILINKLAKKNALKVRF